LGLGHPDSWLKNKSSANGVVSSLFTYVCFEFSDLLLKWSKKDGFFIVFLVEKANMYILLDQSGY
jgi:hypothetical protein